MAPQVLFIGEGSPYSALAAAYISERIPDATVVLWDFGQPHPLQVDRWSGDWIITFKADLILTADMLARASQGAVNIHPAPPRYRGVGGYVYALHAGDPSYGATCHHMVQRLDYGPIIRVDEFPVHSSDTASTLRHRAAVCCLLQLYDVTERILGGLPLPVSTASWSTGLYTRKGLDAFTAEVRAADPGHRCLR